MDMFGAIKATVGAVVAKPGDVKPDGTLPGNKLTAKQASTGAFLGAAPGIVWMLRLMGAPKVGEEDVTRVLMAGVVIFGAAQWMLGWFTKDKHLGGSE